MNVEEAIHLISSSVSSGEFENSLKSVENHDEQDKSEEEFEVIG